jgi:hypothetical protein
MRMENEVFCCCVSKFIRILVGETFSRRRARRRDEKDLFKKKKKTITSKTREQKKQRRDSRDFNTRDNNTLLRRETHF